ncbi:MAG TPA: heterodisulfide reductase-related iron-sulfur binding cluster [Caulobacteraceae bacterium]|nr:heterodisulfide reductase-related iron-sulfur binding cluster [Caulobacteraceae bacterium]
MRAKVMGPLADTVAGARAEAVLRACVHCGMCNAVCPTFQLTGDELDGPRGRIYLMKGALEGDAVGPETLLHLDRCLECRACETACPSGVEYHRLLDVGRPFVETQVRRPWRERLTRSLIRWVTPHPGRFGVALAVGRFFAPVLPSELKAKLPPLPIEGRGRGWGSRGEERDIARHPTASSTGDSPPPPTPPLEGEGSILLAGCAQAVAAPHFNAAAKRVFAKVGIRLAESPAAGCCGAVSFHLDDPAEARAFARRNIDAWTRDLDAGAKSVVVTASGCAAFIKDYPDLLADDPAYAEKARRIAEAVRDPVELLDAAPPAAVRAPAEPRIAVHDPCTLRNGLKLAGRVDGLLRTLGYDPLPVRDAHLCCGSAGPYALTQPVFAAALRANKLAALTEHAPAAICTANIGCWMHLAETSPVPVRHWIEAVDDVT